MVQVKLINHKGNERLAVVFDFDPQLIAKARQVEGYCYSNSKKLFHYPNNKATIGRLREVFGSALSLHLSWQGETAGVEKASARKPAGIEAGHAAHNVHTQKFREWLRSRRYSESTVGTYVDALRAFLRFTAPKVLADITNEDIVRFNNEIVLKHGLSASYQNQVVNAIKLFFSTIEGRRMEIESIHRPKRPKLLPNVLSKEEVKAILTVQPNIKHRTMLSLIYSCGLRCGELLALKPADVDSRRQLLIIRQAKGRKDRIAPLSMKILEMLRAYYVLYKPRVYLFEGQKAGLPYDERSLQHVLKQAVAKAGIQKPVTLHWLRHSYATHLLENGTDLRYIQEILGHKSSRTTEIYTHVSTKSLQRITSPFDSL